MSRHMMSQHCSIQVVLVLWDLLHCQESIDRKMDF